MIMFENAINKTCVCVCVLAYLDPFYFGTKKKTKLASQLCHIFHTHILASFLLSRLKHTTFVQIQIIHTVSLMSVRNHAVHFVSQFVLKARDGLTGSSWYEVSSGALHLVQAHVTGFGDLTLGEAHKLRIPGEDAETLRDQNLTFERQKNIWSVMSEDFELLFFCL